MGSGFFLFGETQQQCMARARVRRGRDIRQGVDAGAQARGHEVLAQGRALERRRKLEMETSLWRSGREESGPHWKWCQLQDGCQVWDLGNRIYAAAFTSRMESSEMILHHLHILQVILSDSHFGG